MHTKESTIKENELIPLLWDYLKRDPEHKDRRQTGWGTKTKQGLVASIERASGLNPSAIKGLVEAAEAITDERISNTLGLRGLPVFECLEQALAALKGGE